MSSGEAEEEAGMAEPPPKADMACEPIEATMSSGKVRKKRAAMGREREPPKAYTSSGEPLTQASREPRIEHVNSLSKAIIPTPTIYKVPQRMRQGNKDAFGPYEPQIVSIGPYHRLKKSLRGFEEHKRCYKSSILKRISRSSLKPNSPSSWDECIDKIRKLKSELRSNYDNKSFESISSIVDRDEPEGSSISDASSISMDDKFVDMMVLDGCFIVELFLKDNKNDEQSEDPIFYTIWMLPLIRYDMLLLENQIPFRVLQLIYETACPGEGLLVNLALDFFKPIMPKISDAPIMDSYFHLLHLFHSHLIPTPINESKNEWKKPLEILRSAGFLPRSNKPQLPTSNNSSPPSPDPEINMIPCAADLQLAGVKFKKKKDPRSILDVEFSRGVLEIPQLLIEDYTNTLFRNLVAFEQCCSPRATIHFTTYVRFMDCLVNTSKDVALLHRDGIIDHLLGSDEDVARLFNQLCDGIFYLENNYLSGLFKHVDKYYNTRWNIWRASLRRDYCTNPWVGLSTVAAVILIILTITQTIYTIYPYYHPRS